MVISYHYLATEGLAIYSKMISDILKIRKKIILSAYACV